jgi:ATP-dependent protease HslVU (ClpYQ) peptidase subunit
MLPHISLLDSINTKLEVYNKMLNLTDAMDLSPDWRRNSSRLEWAQAILNYAPHPEEQITQEI